MDSRNSQIFRVQFLARALAIIVFAGLLAFASDKKTSSAPAKPAAAKPAAGSHPGGSPGASGAHPGGATTHGPTTSHTGPTTGNPSGHAGPTTSNPGGHAGPTTAGRTGATTTGRTGATTTGRTGTTTTGRTGATTTGRTGTTTTGRGTTAGHTSTTASNAHSTSPGAHPVNTSGHVTATAPKGVHTTTTKSGSSIQRRADGKPRDVHDAKRGMDIHHGLNGNRRVEVTRRDGSRIVAARGRRGYIEHRYHYGRYDYGRRSYYYHGRMYDRYYRGYYYHGVYMGVYAPAAYYPGAFYGWAYNPWYAPVAYPWGWAGNPWYGYYGFYFTPYPVYPAAAFWLTDYLISQDLAAAYAARQEAQEQDGAQQASGGAPALTPEVKQQIADEVKSQIALESSEAQQNSQGQEPDPASSGINRMMSDGHPHVFVVGSPLDVVDSTGVECPVSDGDVLEMATPPGVNDQEANVIVLSSKFGQECRKGSTVKVAVTDLQEMQNHMRETIDQGMQELQSKQGTGGLPAAPPSAKAPPVQTAFVQAAPPPDPNGAAEISQQLTQADQAEHDVVAEAAAPPAPGTADSQTPSAAAPVSIAMGDSIDKVTSALGPPQTVVDLGTKKIYKYKDMKITFKNGAVSAVE